MLRTIHGYLLRQLLATLAVCLGVFTFLLLLGNVLKDVLDLLASQEAPVGLVLRALGLLIPFVIAFSLPISFLTAVMLVFGRMSADLELTAMRAGGVCLIQASWPVVGLSLVAAMVAGWLNLEGAPACRLAFKELYRSAIRERGMGSILRPRSYTELKDLVVYVGGTQGGELTDMLVYRYTNGVKWRECRAQSGVIETNGASGAPELVLRNGNALERWPGSEGWDSYAFEELRMSLAMRDGRSTLSPDEMTFAQLQKAMAELAAKGADVTPLLVQVHRQLAFSFACVAFTVLGLPLAIRAHRRETNTGVAIALGLVLVYYGFIVLGQSLGNRPQYLPHLILWAPNFLFQGIGAWLLVRVNR